MWSGTKVVGLLNSECKWTAYFSTHENRQVVQYALGGKEHMNLTQEDIKAASEFASTLEASKNSYWHCPPRR
jgi:hypothetical protein